MKNYTFIKNVKGGLSFTLDSYNMQFPSKNFVIRHNIEQISIPEDYALGLFITSTALEMFKNGYFIIPEIKELKQKAKELGLYAYEDVKNVLTIKEIEKIVVTNNEKKIDEILSRDIKVEVNNLITICREHFDSLSNGIITKVEKACGAELRIE